MPLAFAAAGGSNGGGVMSRAPSQKAPSGTQCPFLQAHPWMDPHTSGDGGLFRTSGTSYQGMMPRSRPPADSLADTRGATAKLAAPEAAR